MKALDVYTHHQETSQANPPILEKIYPLFYYILVVVFSLINLRRFIDVI